MSTTAWLLLALVVAVLFGLAFVVKALLWVAIIAAATEELIGELPPRKVPPKTEPPLRRLARQRTA